MNVSASVRMVCRHLSRGYTGTTLVHHLSGELIGDLLMMGDE